jgi:hypothetical protein
MGEARSGAQRLQIRRYERLDSIGGPPKMSRAERLNDFLL